MPENFAKHPQKFIKYGAITSTAMMSALGMYADWSDDEAEEVMKALPHYYDNNGSVILLPWKDSNGRPQLIDASVFIPYSPHMNMLKGVFAEAEKGSATGAAQEMLNWTGVLGSPVFALGSAIKSGVDPFTKRPIVPPGSSSQEALVAVMRYTWTFVMPPFMTERGGVGHTLDNLGIDTGLLSTGKVLNRLGEDRESTGQASMRFFGFNAIPQDPNLARSNLGASHHFQMRELTTRRNKIMKDFNLSAPAKAKKLRELNERIKTLNKRFQERIN